MDFFSPDYFTARERFRFAASRLGCTLDSRSIEPRSPAGEELTIDVARWGGERVRRILVVSSGLHGVEGLFGSAVQTAWLEACAGATGGNAAPPLGTSVVLIHALNPWGFAHRRRTDEQNIDLNRNFLLPGQEYAGSPALYGTLDPILNPREPPRRFDFFGVRAFAALARHGRSAVTQAIAQGQHDFPRGLFFGGKAQSEVARILSASLPGWVGDARRVLHLDFHTGLGHWGTCKLLADYRLSDSERRLSKAWAGGVPVVEPMESPGEFRNFREGYYRSRGGLGGWCRAKFPDRQYLLLVAEFGTYPPFMVLSKLRSENQAHHFCQPGEKRLAKAKQGLVEAFCSQSKPWRNECIGQAIQLIASGVGNIGSCE